MKAADMKTQKSESKTKNFFFSILFFFIFYPFFLFFHSSIFPLFLFSPISFLISLWTFTSKSISSDNLYLWGPTSQLVLLCCWCWFYWLCKSENKFNTIFYQRVFNPFQQTYKSNFLIEERMALVEQRV